MYNYFSVHRSHGQLSCNMAVTIIPVLIGDCSWIHLPVIYCHDSLFLLYYIQIIQFSRYA